MLTERVAILDASVLMQAPLRDTLLRLAEGPALYRPAWSAEILAETRHTFLADELRRHFPGSFVEGYESLIRPMTVAREHRHVLAAALRAGAPEIVTFDQHRFPARHTEPWKLEAVSPAAFLESLYAASPHIVRERIRQQAADVDRTIDWLLDVLARAVPSFVEAIRGDLSVHAASAR